MGMLAMLAFDSGRTSVEAVRGAAMNRWTLAGCALLAAASLGIASCSKAPSSDGAKRAQSVQELRAGCGALERFAEDLQAQPPENDFQRFAASPYNYTVEVKETAGTFVFTFAIKPYQGRLVKDGTSAYEVSKADMKVTKVRYR